jgi:opacity protein-like surface antigen
MRVFTRMLAFGVSIAVCVPTLTAHAQSAPPIGPSQWEVGITPTLQRISGQLAGNYVWSGGLTLSGNYRLNRVVAFEASLLGAAAPQLNFKNAAVMNSLLPSLSAELHLPTKNNWDPYASLGIGYSRFKFDNPPAGVSGSESYGLARGALGVRYALNTRVNWRAEFSRQFGAFGGSPTFMSGVAIRLHHALVQQ